MRITPRRCWPCGRKSLYETVVRGSRRNNGHDASLCGAAMSQYCAPAGRFTQTSQTLRAQNSSMDRPLRQHTARWRPTCGQGGIFVTMNFGKKRLNQWPTCLSKFGTKCAWFSGTIRADCTIAALHRLFGMSSSQLSTTTRWFGLGPLLAAWTALVAVLQQLIQRLFSQTHGNGCWHFYAVVHPGRWTSSGSGLKPLAVVAPVSWFHTTGRRDGPATAPGQNTAWPTPSTCHCETSKFVEQAFGIRQGRCRRRT